MRSRRRGRRSTRPRSEGEPCSEAWKVLIHDASLFGRGYLDEVIQAA